MATGFHERPRCGVTPSAKRIRVSAPVMLGPRRSRNSIHDISGSGEDEMLGAGQPMLAMDPEEVGHNTPPPDWLLWSAAEMNQLQLGTSPAIAALALVPAVPHFLKAAGIQLSLGDGATEENLNWPDQICSPSPPVLEDPLDQIRSASPPAPEKRRPPINLENPFDENYPERHTMNRTQVLQLEGDVDSYVKFRVRVRNVDRHGTQASLSRRRFKPGRHQRHNIFRRSSPPFDCILRPPPNLGWGATPPSEKDREVFRFYIQAWCPGRTLLSKTNFWSTEIVPMAVAGEKVLRHALCALSSGYILDYLPAGKDQDHMRKRANSHYRRASELITAAINQFDDQTIDATLAAILLLLADDCVNWELRVDRGLRPPIGKKPNWYRAAHLARQLLDHSDPGTRYYKVSNVQCNKVRVANANWAALACILAQPVTPLTQLENGAKFDWLLAGTETEAYKIHGATGLSPKLLHTFSLVTRLCRMAVANPPAVGESAHCQTILESLRDFPQWSELSGEHLRTAKLLQSCDLDAKGKVKTAVEVTELTGEAWVCTAKIYIHCRFFRKPRSHPDVQDALETLIVCINRMPCTGALFTSQAPFFCVFIMALVSYRDADREVARDWFETVVSLSTASCRSSVPPVWEGVQAMWKWMDEELVEDGSFDDSLPVGSRQPWWEDMVAALMKIVGWVSLT